MISFDRVSKYYNHTAALIDFTYQFRERAITTIVGRSGSGKSTLLQLINGLERPTRGQVCVFNRPIDYSQLPALRRRLGYAVQGTGLFPHLTVEKNISLPAKLAGWPADKINSRMTELMHLVGLSEKLCKRYPHELSGGQQQRVGLCRAIMLDPEIFLLDEPFGALDPITRNEIHAEFLRLQEIKPRTIVLVTHDMREAAKLSDDILILEQGKLVQKGSRQDILEHPATPFVQSLIHEQLEL
ncbi:MAG: ABC transporter ATP-binding protein [Calditrichaeota bacterium]|nr:MAG: ABC transporter ATP-binding protein [Calditrichota bacterium]